MTVKQLIKKLKEIDENKICVITDGKGWCNIEKLNENKTSVDILMATNIVTVIKSTKIRGIKNGNLDTHKLFT